MLSGKRILTLIFAFIVHTAVAERWREVMSLEGKWHFAIGDNKKWADPNFNDSGWETIRVPSKWEDEGFNGYNGFAWYRKSFEGTLLKDRSLNYSIFLGYIDDVDEVYFNGHLIGSSGSFPPKYHTAYDARRIYFIPTEYINYSGKNVLAVRVYDAEIEGGIVNGDVGIYTDEDERQMAVNLRGIWNFTTVYKRSGDDSTIGRKIPPTDAKWSAMTVPGYWEHQGFSNYNGAVWYRKQFVIPKALEGQDLVLILGKIDDYDEVYINGKFIGSNRKHDKLRIYNIPSDAYRAGAVNLLSVYVEDYQEQGGMYEGPFGLIREVDLTKFMRWRNR